jgi:hypothetical protein
MSESSQDDWKPVSRVQLEDILRDDVAQLSHDALKIYESYVVSPQEHPCRRGGHYGVERVFVVMRADNRLVFFDDVEDEFAIGVPDSDGMLTEWGLCGSLMDAILLLELPK